ncbi:MAG: transcription antitermination factor NusB [Brevinema sp.]
MDSNKISARRYGRLLAVLSLKNSYIAGSEKQIDELYHEMATTYQLLELPVSVQKQIMSFCEEILESVKNQFDTLVKVINTYSRNRTWDKFSPLDQALLVVGTYDLGNNSSIPKICIKEILIICDMLHNENAVPYLSGILKTIAYGNNKPEAAPIKKRPKIRLKNQEINQ